MTLADLRAANYRSCASIRCSPTIESDALDQLCRYAKHTMLKRGATIVSKGDPGDSLYRGGQRYGENQHFLRRWPQRDSRSNRTRRDFRGSLRCSTGWHGQPTRPQIPIAKFMSLTAATLSPSCEASRRWR